MKVDAKALFEVVRQVVHEEVKKVLPQLIARHLSEQYIKKALAESVVSKPSQRILPKQEYKLPSNIREIIAGDPEEELTPEPMDNTSQGIYEPENPLIKKNETIQKLLSRNNPMAAIYEGLTPIDEANEEAVLKEQSEREMRQMAKATGMDFSKMNAMVERMENKRTPVKSEEQIEKELERKRKLLEVPVRR